MSESAEQYGNGAEKRPLTAVEWLVEMVSKMGYVSTDIFEQAKEMEKEQIMDAQMDMFHHINDFPLGMEYLDKRNSAEKYAEKYHNQPYGK